ncbi:MAG: peptidoglycan-binding protein [Romboutsia sp.]
MKKLEYEFLEEIDDGFNEEIYKIEGELPSEEDLVTEEIIKDIIDDYENIISNRTSYSRPLSLKSPQIYGADVKEVQKRLNALGYSAGTVDGYFGPNADKAVRRFQTVNGLSVDGSVGPTTWNKLFSSSAKPNSSSGSSGYTRPLSLKSPQMYGDDVKKVQSKLNTLKYNAGTANGYFGPNTDKAVKRFQTVNGISADGSVGPVTWNKLFGSSAKPNPSTPTSDIGWYYTDPVSTRTGDLFTFSVRTGGKYPTGYSYRLYSHGRTSSSGAKIWYKENWKEGSTYEIYKAIVNMNKQYGLMVDGLVGVGGAPVAKEIADAIVVWAAISLTPMPFDDLVLYLKGINVANKAIEAIKVGAMFTATTSFILSSCKLKYHWKKI